MEFKALVVQMLPMESGTSKSGKAWQKATLIAETSENPQYPKKVKISNMKNAEAFSKIAIGTGVNFKVEIESREFNGRWYTEVNCWGWDVISAPQPQPQQYQQPQTATLQPQQYVPQNNPNAFGGGMQAHFPQAQAASPDDDPLPF